MLRTNRFLASLALGAAALAPFASARAAEEGEAQARRIVVVRVGSTVREDPAPKNPFGPSQRNFRQTLLRLRRIAADPKVDGIRLEVKGVPDAARTLDLVDELRRIKDAGKKIVCYEESLDQDLLTIASLADLLAIPPSGQVVMPGLTVEAMYLKDLFDALGVRFDVIHIGDFKTAFEEFHRDRMSDSQRTMIEEILEERYEQTKRLIAEHRGIAPERVEQAFTEALLEPERARELGLVDAVVYRDEFDDRVERLFGGEVEYDRKYGERSVEDLEKMLESPFALFQMLPKLLKPERERLPDEPRIAIVYATGPITSGKSQRGFDGSVVSMGSDTIVEALEKTLEDDWIRAVVLRVNSPGGSALASDMIWRATQRVRAKKPIVASMGSVAASGGYWISMGCDRIVAQPSTLTGSIGVVGMLPDLTGTLRKLGVRVETVSKGPRAEDFALLAHGPTPFLRTRIRDSMEKVYSEFVRKVAEGRRMQPEIVETIARGRVWTGRQALDLNLVDELGGLDRAVALACELAGGLDPNTTRIVEYPEPKGFFEQLEEAFEELTLVPDVRAAALRAVLGERLGELESLARSVVSRRASVFALSPWMLWTN